MKLLYRTLLLLSLISISQSGCKPNADGAFTEKSGREGGRHALTVLGYNYTDQDINSFDVLGAGGAMLGVSSETSGGGGAVCCVVWHDGTPLPVKVTVKWAYDACEYLSEPDPLYGNRIEAMKTYYREDEVDLTEPVPAKPTSFTVHFYPDKHVEVAIAEGFPDPRLKLPDSRSKPFRRCALEEVAR